jgi:hypothetical protein
MFAKDKVSQSMIDAVNSVINEGKVDESSEKVPTSTGMKVYGSSYGGRALRSTQDSTIGSLVKITGGAYKGLVGRVVDSRHREWFLVGCDWIFNHQCL